MQNRQPRFFHNFACICEKLKKLFMLHSIIREQASSMGTIQTQHSVIASQTARYFHISCCPIQVFSMNLHCSMSARVHLSIYICNVNHSTGHTLSLNSLIRIHSSFHLSQKVYKVSIAFRIGPSKGNHLVLSR